MSTQDPEFSHILLFINYWISSHRNHGKPTFAPPLCALARVAIESDGPVFRANVDALSSRL